MIVLINDIVAPLSPVTARALLENWLREIGADKKTPSAGWAEILADAYNLRDRYVTPEYLLDVWEKIKKEGAENVC